MRSKTQTAALPLVEAGYPNQYKRMVGFLGSRGVPAKDIHDLINDAQLRATESFDPSKGIDPIQWAWWLLQRNMLPAFGRGRKRTQGEQLPADDMLAEPAGEEDEQSADRAMEIVNYLKAHLPEDLVAVLEAIQSVKAEMDSDHIYAAVADSLMIPIKECRNRVKRLRRASLKLLHQWEKRTL